MGIGAGFSYNFQKIEASANEQFIENRGGQTFNLDYLLTKVVSRKSKITATIGIASTRAVVKYFGFTTQGLTVLSEPNFNWFDEFFEDRSFAHYLNGSIQFQYKVLKKREHEFYLAPRFSYRQFLGVNRNFQNIITNAGVFVQVRDKGDFANRLHDPVYQQYHLIPGISIGVNLSEVGCLELKFEHTLNTIFESNSVELDELLYNVRYSSLGIYGGFYF